MRSWKHSVLPAAAFLTACLSVAAGAQDAGSAASAETAKLADVLKSDAPAFEKAMACRRLAVIGNREGVPALAGLLADANLATYARTGLEGIPDPAADQALREAAGRLQGNLLIGVLGSIGKRRDGQAVDTLAGLLKHQDRAVAAAAARALGYVGNDKAAGVLQAALADSAAELRSAVATACLICGARLGQAERAVALYDAVRQADVPEEILLAATQRAIVARGKAGLPLLAEQLASADPARFRLALQAARDLGPDAGKPLLERFPNEPAPRQALLIPALSDLGDRAALPLVLGAARSGAAAVRIPALEALARFNDPAAIPVLLEAAVEQDAEVAQAAHATLSALDSGEINAAIARLLGGDEPRTLEVAIQLAGRRGIASASPALLQLSKHPDVRVRAAAVKSLGATIELADLAKLIALAIAPPSADLQSVAVEALKSACARLPRQGCTEQLAAALTGASVESQVRLLEQIAAVGGPDALRLVVTAARSPEDALQDAATRLLGEWLTADAAPELLGLAKTLASGKYRIRALRGYVRIARQLNMTPEERLDVCRNTLAMAERSEEKLLAVETLGRVRSPAALAAAAALLKDKDLQTPACAAIVALADSVATTAPEETEKALEQVLALTADATVRQRVEKQIAAARDLARQRREEPQFVSLFDRQTLEGWEGDSNIFRVEDGAVVGGSVQKPIGRGNDFLCTKQEYGDFELRLQFKLLGQNANGGVNVRSKRNPDNGVASGYQADLGAGYWGCLYDEARRNRVLAQAAADPQIRENDWNEYRILCQGRRIQLWINGIQTVDYMEQDEGLPPRGILALQVQANRPSEAWYRNLRIKPL